MAEKRGGKAEEAAAFRHEHAEIAGRLAADVPSWGSAVPGG